MINIEKKVHLPEHNNYLNIYIEIYGNDEYIISQKEELLQSGLINQYVTNLKKCIIAYELSPLPERFINSQKFNITNTEPYVFCGAYNINNGDIYLNPDSLIGISDYSGEFVFGHEIGHKIQEFRNCEEVYEIVRRIYNTNNPYFLEEIFSDICGTMVSQKKEIKRYPMNEEIHNILKQKVLKCIYRG